ncbi:LytR family transcriptional regulator, partial [Streptomyces sp. SB3404]|nr:LytR family transcriptional regulator [Streptomyces boncukensis]
MRRDNTPGRGPRSGAPSAADRGWNEDLYEDRPTRQLRTGQDRPTRELRAADPGARDGRKNGGGDKGGSGGGG